MQGRRVDVEGFFGTQPFFGVVVVYPRAGNLRRMFLHVQKHVANIVETVGLRVFGDVGGGKTFVLNEHMAFIARVFTVADIGRLVGGNTAATGCECQQNEPNAPQEAHSAS